MTFRISFSFFPMCRWERTPGSLPHQRGEIVVGGFGAADQLYRPVLFQQQLGAAEPPVILVAHGEAVGAGVVDVEQVALVDLRQHPVNGELIVVLAQAAYYVILVVAGGMLLAHDRDMVIRAVHGGAHQVGGAGVHADVFLIGVLLMGGGGHQRAVGRQHKPTHFGKQLHISHASGNQNLLELLPNALADGKNVVFLLIRAIGNANAAGEVDEVNVTAGFLLKIHGQLEQNPRQRRVIVVGDGIGGQKGVNAKVLCAHAFELLKALIELLGGEAILGIAGGVHDLKALLGGGQLEHTTGIIPAGDGFGDIPDGVL